jgi:hypothetical protein
MLGKVSSFCCLINMVLNFNVSNWFCVDMCWGVFLGCGRVVFSSFLYFRFCCCAEYYLLRCSLLACHLAAESGIRAAASSVYFISAGGGWFTSWGGGEGGLSLGVFAIFYFYRKRWLASWNWVGGLDELHGVNFFVNFFYMFKIVIWMLRFSGSIFLYFGWFQFSVMDGWFLLGIVLIFLALCFFVLFW